MTIRPIETRYKGYRFRSRLEARWAVFFDALNIAWKYEPQGFRIPRKDGSSTPYLPDFLLSDCGTWIEVKGDEGDLDKDLMRAAGAHLPRMPYKWEPGPPLMVLGDIPEPVEDGDWGWLALGCPDEFTADVYSFAMFHKCSRPWGLYATEPDPYGLYGSRTRSWLEPSWSNEDSVNIPHAYRAARSARFEHGEVPSR